MAWAWRRTRKAVRGSGVILDVALTAQALNGLRNGPLRKFLVVQYLVTGVIRWHQAAARCCRTCDRRHGRGGTSDATAASTSECDVGQDLHHQRLADEASAAAHGAMLSVVDRVGEAQSA